MEGLTFCIQQDRITHYILSCKSLRLVVELSRKCERLEKTERYNQKTIQIVCESFWEREEFVQRLRHRSYERKASTVVGLPMIQRLNTSDSEADRTFRKQRRRDHLHIQRRSGTRGHHAGYCGSCLHVFRFLAFFY